MAEICHNSFVINRENIKLRAQTVTDLNISRLKVSDFFLDLRNLFCLVFLYYVSECLWEQIHIKHLINYQNRIFNLISHYFTIVFESNSEIQRFAFTTRRGYPGFCVRGGRNSAMGSWDLKLAHSHAASLKLFRPQL